MLSVTGKFILVLVQIHYGNGGITAIEMDSQQACRNALVQLQPVRSVQGYCIAAEVEDE